MSLTCKKCSKDITAGAYSLLDDGLAFHQECFTCSLETCGKVLNDSSLIGDGGFYHQDCFDIKFAKPCLSCHQKIKVSESSFKIGSDKQVHKDCFVCFHCRKGLGERFMEKAGKYFDIECFNAMFSVRCDKCTKAFALGTSYSEVSGRKYHTECLTCKSCSTNLSGQQFSVVESDHSMMCQPCLHKDVEERSKRIQGVLKEHMKPKTGTLAASKITLKHEQPRLSVSGSKSDIAAAKANSGSKSDLSGSKTELASVKASSKTDISIARELSNNALKKEDVVYVASNYAPSVSSPVVSHDDLAREDETTVPILANENIVNHQAPQVEPEVLSQVQQQQEQESSADLATLFKVPQPQVVEPPIQDQINAIAAEMMKSSESLHLESSNPAPASTLIDRRQSAPNSEPTEARLDAVAKELLHDAINAPSTTLVDPNQAQNQNNVELQLKDVAQALLETADTSSNYQPQQEMNGAFQDYNNNNGNYAYSDGGSYYPSQYAAQQPQGYAQDYQGQSYDQQAYAAQNQAVYNPYQAQAYAQPQYAAPQSQPYAQNAYYQQPLMKQQAQSQPISRPPTKQPPVVQPQPQPQTSTINRPQPIVNNNLPKDPRVKNGCAKCRKPCLPTEAFLTLKDNVTHFHRACFNCEICYTALNRRYAMKNNKYYHAECYQNAKNNAPKCLKCYNAINPSDISVALGNDSRFHKQCFACDKCTQPLNERFYATKGQFLHEECIACENCQSGLVGTGFSQLADGGFICDTCLNASMAEFQDGSATAYDPAAPPLDRPQPEAIQYYHDNYEEGLAQKGQIDPNYNYGYGQMDPNYQYGNVYPQANYTPQYAANATSIEYGAYVPATNQ